jgi:hypothetical protein
MSLVDSDLERARRAGKRGGPLLDELRQQLAGLDTTKEVVNQSTGRHRRCA